MYVCIYIYIFVRNYTGSILCLPRVHLGFQKYFTFTHRISRLRAKQISFPFHSPPVTSKMKNVTRTAETLLFSHVFAFVNISRICGEETIVKIG